jgi:energy-coupling factor transporter ATP-binding protein EcfA2
MSKEFNITGTCLLDRHYMADVSCKMKETISMIEKGRYFIINRPRQYGKTTTFHYLTHTLNRTKEYMALRISFEGVGDSAFLDELKFVKMFMNQLYQKSSLYAPDYKEWLEKAKERVENLGTLSNIITEFCKEVGDKKIVVLIDEVDKSSNNQLFVSFLAMLRDKYLERGEQKTFHSVVLAGVHDVKSLKIKLRPDEESKLNSPWNIATDFKVDMNLYPKEIKPMLDDYVAERGVKMNTKKIAEHIFYYTSGYPFLVSKLCKTVDEDYLPKRKAQKWTLADIDQAALDLTRESNANFDSLVKNLEDNKELYDMIYGIAVDNQPFSFNIHNPLTNLATLYGIVTQVNGRMVIHNRIYNEVILNYMADQMHQKQFFERNDFGGGYINNDNSLNMELVLIKYQAFMREQYSKKDRTFLERNGRLVFLAFMKPILNGGGHDFKEAQISEERRLDVVLTYYNHKYVAELKIWRGEVAHKEGLLQLADYLDKQSLNEGYLVIFDHSAVKSWKTDRVEVKGKNIFMVWV